MPKRTINPHPIVTRLLNHAYEQSAHDLAGLDANDPTNLRRLEDAVRENIGYQVGAGMWAKCGISDMEQLARMKIVASLGNTLVGEPSILINTDFTGTPLALVTVEMRARAKGNA